MPEETPLMRLGQTCEAWAYAGIGGAGSVPPVLVVEGFHLKQLDETKRKLFGTLISASQFWANGSLGLNTLTTKEIETMKMFERELGAYIQSPDCGGDLEPVKKEMCFGLIGSFRDVRRAWEKERNVGAGIKI